MKRAPKSLFRPLSPQIRLEQLEMGLGNIAKRLVPDNATEFLKNALFVAEKPRRVSLELSVLLDRVAKQDVVRFDTVGGTLVKKCLIGFFEFVRVGLANGAVVCNKLP